jgi:hypothetical protein
MTWNFWTPIRPRSRVSTVAGRYARALFRCWQVKIQGDEWNCQEAAIPTTRILEIVHVTCVNTIIAFGSCFNSVDSTNMHCRVVAEYAATGTPFSALKMTIRAADMQQLHATSCSPLATLPVCNLMPRKALGDCSKLTMLEVHHMWPFSAENGQICAFSKRLILINMGLRCQNRFKRRASSGR